MEGGKTISSKFPRERASRPIIIYPGKRVKNGIIINVEKETLPNKQKKKVLAIRERTKTSNSPYLVSRATSSRISRPIYVFFSGFTLLSILVIYFMNYY